MNASCHTGVDWEAQIFLHAQISDHAHTRRGSRNRGIKYLRKHTSKYICIYKIYVLKLPTMRIHDEEAVIEVHDTCAYTHMNVFLSIYMYTIFVLKSLTMRLHDEETIIEVYDTCAYTHIYI